MKCVKEKQVFAVNENLFSLVVDFKGSTQCCLLLTLSEPPLHNALELAQAQCETYRVTVNVS